MGKIYLSVSLTMKRPSLDIDGKDISLIRNLYWNQKAYMRTEDGLSSEIHIKRGGRQVCVLSLCLFNLYTENIFGAMNTDKGIHIGGTTINNLRYADDTVLLAETEEDLQEILNEVNRIGKMFNMKMNGKKTKTTVFDLISGLSAYVILGPKNRPN